MRKMQIKEVAGILKGRLIVDFGVKIIILIYSFNTRVIALQCLKNM